LRFRIIHTSAGVEEFRKAAKKTAKKLEWEIEYMTNDIMIATSGFSGMSWGERITIIRDKDRVLFNSIFATRITDLLQRLWERTN
jgi:hypothetical protein